MADGKNNYYHPGVYIEELPGLPTIQSVATSIPIFVGITETLPPSSLNVAQPVNGWADYQAKYGQFVFGSQTSAAVYQFFAGGGTKCYVVGVNPGDSSKAAPSAAVLDPAVKITVTAACIGDWQKDLLTVATADVVQPPGKDPSNFFSVYVLVLASALVTPKTVWASLLKAYVKSNSSITITLENKAYYVLENFRSFASAPFLSQNADVSNQQLTKMANLINAKSMFIRVSCAKGAGLSAMQDRNKVKAFAGGSFGTGSSYVDATYQALSSPQDASLVATPDAAAVDIALDYSKASDYKAVIITGIMQALTNKRLRNLFYVIDAPFVGDYAGTNTGSIGDFVQGTKDNQPLSSEYAACYYPWPVVRNPISGSSVPVPPSGAVLGCYASTDENAGVHVSPAGAVNGHIPTATSLTQWVTEIDQDSLNPAGINAIRSIPGYGITVYGARTLAGPGEWQYVAVRRFVTFFEQSVKTFLETIVFAPNDEMLWATASAVVTAFARQLWQQGALMGATPKDAFFVTCDDTNNPPDQRKQGILIIDVGLAVIYPAEFVVLRVSQRTSAAGS
jgi:phage tail sheath protein FI